MDTPAKGGRGLVGDAARSFTSVTVIGKHVGIWDNDKGSKPSAVQTCMLHEMYACLTTRKHFSLHGRTTALTPQSATMQHVFTCRL